MYFIEKTVDVTAEIAGEEKRIRIEAVRHQDGRFSTRAYIHEFVTVQPTYPQTGENFDRKPTDFGVWVDYSELPWTDGNSADSVIRQALGFLNLSETMD